VQLKWVTARLHTRTSIHHFGSIPLEGRLGGVVDIPNAQAFDIDIRPIAVYNRNNL